MDSLLSELKEFYCLQKLILVGKYRYCKRKLVNFLIDLFCPYRELAGEDLVELVRKGYISGIAHNAIQPASIDVRLHNYIQIEDIPDWENNKHIVKPGVNTVTFKGIYLGDTGYFFSPSQFALGALQECFRLPNNISGTLFLNSTVGRAGIQHSLAIQIVPGWEGRLTLELTNATEYHVQHLTELMPIGTIKFIKHRFTTGYIGKYMNQISATAENTTK